MSLYAIHTTMYHYFFLYTVGFVLDTVAEEKNEL